MPRPRRNPALPVFVGTTVLAFAAVVLAAFLLPDRVPTHFGGSGAADDWSSRAGALTFLSLLTAGMTALFAGLAWWMPRVGWEWVNLPAKQRWAELGLQDEVRRRLRTDVLWTGSAMSLFEIAVTSAVVDAARSGTDRLPGWALVAFVVWLVVFVGYAASTPLRYRPPAG
ncbi:DUF1648 domain-containing protein [Kineococcus sp. SYSU DK003]|uniref:DUF1648 domain-containing protein n=1 Tax=Kineococcus sp. SYSU DK003 TaxID=3383124 RepID=UPI003D7ECB68